MLGCNSSSKPAASDLSTFFLQYKATLSICLERVFYAVDANSSLIGYNLNVTVHFALEEGKNMLLYSTMLDVNDTLTKEKFIQLVIKWNQESQYEENVIPGLVWDGQMNVR